MDKSAIEPRLPDPTPWTHVTSAAAAFFTERLIGRPNTGSVTITFPNGNTRTYGKPGAGEHPRLLVRNFSMIPETLRRGTVGFAHAYMRGDVEVEDLTALFRYFLQNRNVFQPKGAGWFGRATADIAYHLSRANTVDGSKENISEHYDLGNDFYKEWLDPSMTYSSAIFADLKNDDLEAAQRRKYRRVAELAGVKQGESVLEIGCGWGGFAETVSKEFGASVYGITLSKEQLAYAQARIARQGLDPLASFHFEDYRHTTGQYDHIGSIEMIEAVGEEHWPSYFQTLHDRLKPGGTAAIQAITIDEADFEGYRSTPDFIQRYIFPGGMLLTRKAMEEQGKRVGLVLEQVELFGHSYAETLRRWRVRFLERWQTIKQLGFDEQFRRKWIYYLAYCEAGFDEGSIDVGIYQYRRPA
ncbi:MAG: class I SAM-dependent methyltransferase [Hyphomicrobiales bacterium]|nr:MAG: class I SAM-dependent methyltransferase [Hyphomicrobiales bacterium]